jgi:hypothetical protein
VAPTPGIVGPLPEGACTQCGTVNPPDIPFCGSCGAFLEWAVAPQRPPDADNDRPEVPA